jgi:hypothetical protein
MVKGPAQVLSQDGTSWAMRQNRLFFFPHSGARDAFMAPEKYGSYSAWADKMWSGLFQATSTQPFNNCHYPQGGNRCFLE